MNDLDAPCPSTTFVTPLRRVDTDDVHQKEDDASPSVGFRAELDTHSSPAASLPRLRAAVMKNQAMCFHQTRAFIERTTAYSIPIPLPSGSLLALSVVPGFTLIGAKEVVSIREP